MRLPFFAVLPVACLAIGCGGFAQKPGGRVAHGMLFPYQMALEKLAPDERAKIEAAFEKAKVDPDYTAARQDREAVGREFQHALNQEMVKQDPSVQPILDKLAKPRPATPPPVPAPSPEMQSQALGSPSPRLALIPSKRELFRDRMLELSPAERNRFRNARRAAIHSPDLKPIEEKRKKAEQQFREALRAAMLKADPTIMPLMDEIEEASAQARPRLGKPR